MFKKFFLILVMIQLVFIAKMYTQIPQALSYQAIARNASGNLLFNQGISLRISILDSSATGSILYQEAHNVVTNDFGLFTINLGSGSVLFGSFSAINWGVLSKFLKVEMDINGGSNFSSLGTSQLLSVPYALYASKAHHGLTGSGNANFTAKFITVDSLGNSIVYDNGVSVGIGTTNPDPSAILHLSSTSQGFLLPKMSSAQRLAINNPATGLLVIDTTLNKIFIFSPVSLDWTDIIDVTFGSDDDNTLDEAYDEGGSGLGRIISVTDGAVEMNGNGTSTALRITNSTNKGIEVTTNDKGVVVNTSSGIGNAIEATSASGSAYTASVTTIGHGLFAYNNALFPSSNLIHSSMKSNSIGDWFDENHRAGFFEIVHAANNRAALEGRTLGIGHGVVGITDAFPALFTEVIPVSGVSGLSYGTFNRNGVSGFSKNLRGVWGKTLKTNNWTDDPSLFNSGVFGTSSAPDNISVNGSQYVGVVGVVGSGAGVIGVSNEYGHGVIGVTKGSGTGGSQAGVWGAVMDGTWANHSAVTNYPFVDAGMGRAKGEVGVLGQSNTTTAVWAESIAGKGLVTTTGTRKGSSTIPSFKSALMAFSSQADAVTTYISNSGSPAFPALKIESSTIKGPTASGAYIVDVTGYGTGGGINLLNLDTTTSMPSLNILNGGTGFAVRIHKSNVSTIGVPPALFVTTAGKGKAGAFAIENTTNSVEALTATTAGTGSAAAFIVSDTANAAPALHVSTAGKGVVGNFVASKISSIEPAVEITKAGSGSGILINCTNDTAKHPGIDLNYKGLRQGVKIVNAHASPSAPLGDSAVTIHAESSLGPVAHFDSKYVGLSSPGGTSAEGVIFPPATAPVMLISSSSPLQTGLKITTVGFGPTKARALDVDGDMDVTGFFKTPRISVDSIKPSGGLTVMSGGMTVTGTFKTLSAADIPSITATGGSTTINGGLNVTGTTTLQGALSINSTVQAALKQFRIDHPLDPRNKYLMHASIESDKMTNLYSGTITTDENGIAIVVFPEWMMKLNKDFTYILTPIGSFSQLMVKEEMTDNKFIIQSDKPRIKLSWMVTGIRKDVFAENYNFQVEVEKPSNEKGTYLHPELYIKE